LPLSQVVFDHAGEASGTRHHRHYSRKPLNPQLHEPPVTN
jgi:hypothetical protein